jgi:hypothetical protein
MMTAPAVVFLPNSVPWGPRSRFDIGQIVEIAADHALTPGVDAVDEDAHRTVDAIGVEAVVADATNAKVQLLGIGQVHREGGNLLWKSVKLTRLSRVSSAADRVVTGIGTDCAFSARLRA